MAYVPANQKNVSNPLVQWWIDWLKDLCRNPSAAEDDLLTLPRWAVVETAMGALQGMGPPTGAKSSTCVGLEPNGGVIIERRNEGAFVVTIHDDLCIDCDWYQGGRLVESRVLQGAGS